MGIRVIPAGPSSGEPVTVVLSWDQVQATEPWARRMAIGGDSFRSRADRAVHLLADQRVGQRGEAALSVWLTGGLTAYLEARLVADTRAGGDGGHDLPGLPVDIKTRRRLRGWDLWAHDLAVRPREKRTDWRYVLAILDALAEPGEPQAVHLMGWTPSERLAFRTSGGLAGNWVINAAELNPLTADLRHQWASERTANRRQSG